MKLQNSVLMKLTMLFASLLITRCSNNSTGVSTSPPNFTPSMANTPIPATITAISPMIGKITFVHGSGNISDNDIYVMDVDGTGLKNLTTNTLYNGQPAWSPDAKYIVFSSIAFTSPTDGKYQIYTMKADGSDLKQLTFDKAYSSYLPAWSPDGKYIIFLSTRDDMLDNQGDPIQEAYIMNSDGSEQRRLTNSQVAVGGLSWYPNGNLISVSVAATRYTLKTYLVDINGTIQKQNPGFIVAGIPIWSPNGKLVLFDLSVSPTDCSGIVVMNADNSNQICLIIDKIFPPVHVGGASWSPDGKYIIFSSNLDGDSDIYVVKPDGSDLTQLTNMAGDESEPVWSSGP